MLLYVHIPFCDSKCHYCAFNSYTQSHTHIKYYMQALVKDLKKELSFLRHISFKISSVFIGGGTPSVVQPHYYKELFQTLWGFLEKECEITIEANPNSASKQWLEQMYSLGVRRVSFGVQSFDDKKLQFLGRAHTQYEAKQAIENAQSIGFQKINADLIYGVHKDCLDLLYYDVWTVSSMGVGHLSAYDLTIEKKTVFENRPQVKSDSQEFVKDFFEQIRNFGYTQYEISNFAKTPQEYSKHNLGYWSYKQYLGVGAGAVGCTKNVRITKEPSIDKYIQNPFAYESEILSAQDITTEKVLLGLRSQVGFAIDILNTRQKQRVDTLIKEQKVFLKQSQVYTTEYLLADALALYILE